jgi:hypothetical protein
MMEAHHLPQLIKEPRLGIWRQRSFGRRFGWHLRSIAVDKKERKNYRLKVISNRPSVLMVT